MGKSFTAIHAGYRGTQVNDLAIDAAGRLLVATINSAGVFRSTKDGTYETIGETLPPPFIIGVQAVAAAPGDPDRYLVVAADNTAVGTIFRTTDGGQSWSAATISGPPVSAQSRIAFASSDAMRVYAVPVSGGLLRSLDGGQTFSSMAVGGDRALGRGIDPLRPERVFAWMHAGGLFQSVDGGESWLAVDTDEARRRSTAQAGLTALVVAPDSPGRVYFGNGSVLQFVDD